MCMSHSNGIDFCQSGGGEAACTTKAVEEEEMSLACGMQVHRVGRWH